MVAAGYWVWNTGDKNELRVLILRGRVMMSEVTKNLVAGVVEHLTRNDDRSVARMANEVRVNGEGLEKARLELAAARDSWRQARADGSAGRMDEVLRGTLGR